MKWCVYTTQPKKGDKPQVSIGLTREIEQSSWNSLTCGFTPREIIVRAGLTYKEAKGMRHKAINYMELWLADMEKYKKVTDLNLWKKGIKHYDL